MTKSTQTERYGRFRELLAEARKDRKISQAELAERLNKPQSFVAKYELGERRLDLVEFLDVARAIGIDPVNVLRQIERLASD